MYGKSAIGLAESLNLHATTESLIEAFPNEIEDLINNSAEEYKLFCLENHNGKSNKISKKTFVKTKRQEGLFLPDVITGDDLVQRFRNAFPKLHSYLSDGAEKAVTKLHIRTKDVFGRIRFFESPDNRSEENAIFREAMNMPIQGSSANMSKYAAVLIKKYIENNNLTDKIKFLFSIHDEILTKVTDDFAEEWLKIKSKIMEEAGEFVLDNKLQKCEGKLSSVWEK
jgi:hypothetical protein